MNKRLKVTRFITGFTLVAILCGCVAWFSPVSNAVIDTVLFGLFSEEETVLSDDGTHEIVVTRQRRKSPIKCAYITVRNLGQNELVYECENAYRLIDFRGVYWAKDSLDFYVSSGDVGIDCFVYEKNAWWIGALKQTESGDWVIEEFNDELKEGFRKKEVSSLQIPQQILGEYVYS